MASLFFLLTLFLLCLNSIYVVGVDLIFEDGYTVSTVIDGHKLNVNPYSVLPQPGSSDLVILDSSEGIVYTSSFYSSQEGVIKRLAGSGVVGYVDGDLEAARFKKLKSFAVDMKGNVYVADKGNLAIRKISKSGVTTIAGGYSKVPGHADGPARNATFSDDFELAFIPERCVLMISDHGNKLVRQINLKPEDCPRDSQSVGGITLVWAVSLGISSLFGLIVGFMFRPYVITQVIIALCFVMFSYIIGLPMHCLTKSCRQEASTHLQFSKTGKQCLTSSRKQALTPCFDIRSTVVSSKLYALLWKLIMLSLSHLSLMFRLNVVESRNLSENSTPFIGSDKLSSNEIAKPGVLLNQLNDLISWDECLQLSDTSAETSEQADDGKVRNDTLSGSHGRIDDMIQANITDFAEQVERTPSAASLGSSSCLVRRRFK